MLHICNMLPCYTSLVLLLFKLFYISSAQNLTYRIWGGKPAAIEKFSYIIHFASTPPFRNMCAGVIITPKVILTAAHCIEWGRKHTPITIRAGTETRTEFDLNHVTIRGVRDTVIHPQYKTWDYDIGLAWLDKEITYNGKTIKAVPALPNQDEPLPPTGTKATLIGWGMDHLYRFPIDLRVVDLPLIDQNKCKQLWSASNITISSRMLCAGRPTGGADACKGDGGAPLMVGNKLIGITVFGPFPCGNEKLPGVFLKIASFRQWIDDNVRNDGIPWDFK